VVGEITNEVNSTAHFVKVSGAFYNYDHQIIGDGTIYANDIPPGQTMPFDMRISSVPNQYLRLIMFKSRNIL
jgi:hypothetical protein